MAFTHITSHTSQTGDWGEFWEVKHSVEMTEYGLQFDVLIIVKICASIADNGTSACWFGAEIEMM